tara:strand:- start:484 stop:1065 length:582 start_codon:yes stop_codon:yes gene_type:complete
MHVKANIDDCAIIINEFLPSELFKQIANIPFAYYEHSSSYKNWDESLYKDIRNIKTMKPVNQTESLATIEKGKIVTDIEILNNFCQTLIDCPFIPYQINSSINIYRYEYNKFSGINWHDDGKYTLNYSFYIHDNWDDNWGGETLIDTKRGLPLVSYPYPNTLLAIKNGIKHKVCPVTGPMQRKVLQVRGVFYE